MKARKRPRTVLLPAMIADLMLASWETIARRTLLMAQNKCSPAEYRRMIEEKSQAAAASASLMISGGRSSMVALLAPWHRRAVGNAKRLRRK